uniref:Putative peptide zinc metalloprotease protein n=1 Tax=Candidatus Kentrum eta TaxID=2126337 RepID=A0A450UAA4_9GAMM|nr:MAG: putative peptide zinc metalloprotease protein [Candidatus Kentron sp. H]VFJ89058.1 MAG: putative peptide zinc metalloprotease protein [Candidatus Kentron sp. H]VFJ95751.1 MAG: putative peptide zinc metalloprotease protein [Candidatus Kentron sp. H]
MTTLPPLRDELALYPRAPANDGSPTWLIHDPARNQFFHIRWGVFEILSRWALGQPGLIRERVGRETTLTVTDDDVEATVRFLAANHLLNIPGAKGTAHLLKALARAKLSRFRWLLHNYLFFKIPLIRPDRFLSATVDHLAWIGSRPFGITTLLSLALGLGLVIRQWDGFVATFIETLTWDGLLRYGLALVVSKLVHEFAHAYTAKRFGCHIPTMGIGFMLFWPLPYTDTTETWKLQARRQRMMVGAAGMMAEGTLAAYATLAWSFLPEGGPRESAFTLAAVAWLSSFIINLLPFLRFDGYYLLSDWLEVPNLHQRAFALGRWWLREALFALGEAPPERFPPRRTRFLVFFAFLVWVYRLFLFLGIAVLVYHFFVKAVGILLFAVEIGWFILRPVMEEIKAWSMRRNAILRSRRTFLSAALLGVLIALGTLPWYGRITAPALLQAHRQATLYTASPALVTDIAVREGEIVTEDRPLFSLANPDLVHRRHRLETGIGTLRYELKSSHLEPSFQQRNQTIFARLREAEAERMGVEKELARLEFFSPFPTGRVVDIDPDLTPGQWLGAGHKLAIVLAVDPHGAFEAGIIAYVDEDTVHRIAPGADCRFYAQTLVRDGIRCSVSLVEKTAARTLAEPAFASSFGGEMKVRVMDETMVPERAHYRLRIAVASGASPPETQVLGQVSITASRESFFARFWRFAVGVLIRESGM